MSITGINMQPAFTANRSGKKEKNTFKNPYFWGGVAIVGGTAVYLATRGKAKHSVLGYIRDLNKMNHGVKTEKEAYRESYKALADNIVETFKRSEMRSKGIMHIAEERKLKAFFSEDSVIKELDKIYKKAIAKKPKVIEAKKITRKFVQKVQRQARNFAQKIQKVAENKV